MRQQIRLLDNTLTMETDGQPSDLMKNAKGCALLAYLIMTPKRHSREVVADLLWQSSSTAKSLKNLRTLLPYMRKWVIGLEVTRQTIAYTPGPDVFVDVFALQSALAQDNISQLDKALHLYKENLLNTFYLPDALQFNEWLTLARENLRQQVIQAYHRICLAYAEQQEWVKGVATAQRWLALDELDEIALRQLLQFLAASGQVALALQQYQHSRQRLRDILQVDPEPATMALAQKLAQLKSEKGEGLTWDVIVGAQVTWPSANELAEPGQLPQNAIMPYQRNRDFVGRHHILLHLATLFLPHSSEQGTFTRAVAISGLGGLGKTQLAVEFAYRYGRYFPGGVFWVSFAEADNIPEEVAILGSERSLGLYQSVDQLTLNDKVGRVQKAWQEPIPRLLIFDNCEDDTLLANWLPKTGGCRILLTSRRGHWARELNVTIQPLPPLSTPESIALLQQLSPDISTPNAQAISQTLGHLPLALHLAGSFLNRYRQITPETYLSQLQNNTLLTHPSLRGRGLTFSPTGHELSIARTFALSLQQLDGDEAEAFMAKQILRHVVCFAPSEPIPLKLLWRTVVEDESDLNTILLAEDGLAWLVALGLLSQEGDTLVLHRLLALFIKATLTDEGHTQNVIESRLLTWLDTIYQKENSLPTQPMLPIHLHYITDMALKRADVLAIRLSNYWSKHLLYIADYDKAAHYLQQSLTIQQTLLGPTHPETAHIHSDLGYLYMSKGNYSLSQQHYEQALTIREQALAADHLDTADSLHNLGVLAIEFGDYQKAQHYLQRALQIREQLLDTHAPLTAESLSKLGAAYWYSSNYAAAQPYFEKALSIQKETLGIYHAQTAISFHSLGALYLELGHYDKAQDYLEEALKITSQLRGIKHPITAVHKNLLGHTHRHLGHYEPAQTYLEQALTTKVETIGHNHPSTAATLNGLAELVIDIGDYEKAQTYLEEAQAIIQKTLNEQHPALARTFVGFARLHQVLGQTSIALTYYQRALTIREAETSPNHPEIAYIFTHIGQTLQQTGDYQAAQHHLETALSIHQTENTPPYRMIETLISFSDLQQAMGNLEAARHYLDQALSIQHDNYGDNHPSAAQINHKLQTLL